MFTQLDIPEFLAGSGKNNILVIDARSPGEFLHGHLPGAINLPLLNNEEREIIGILYKQSGKKAAVIKGFDLVGHKFGNYIKQVHDIYQDGEIYLYCWRGGMRSNIMAWLLHSAGYKINILKDGYKSFRRFVLQTIDKKYNFIVLGGKTGSGKTNVLNKLIDAGEQVIDLESLASHRGSAFGSLGMPPQPSYEHFENLIALKLSSFNKNKIIWIENESRKIGALKIPDNIYNQIRNSIVFELKLIYEERLKRILSEYATFPVYDLEEKSYKIIKRLGPNKLKESIDHLHNNNFAAWAEIMLKYYDDNYEFSNSLRKTETIINIDLNEITTGDLISYLVEKAAAATLTYEAV